MYIIIETLYNVYFLHRKLKIDFVASCTLQFGSELAKSKTPFSLQFGKSNDRKEKLTCNQTGKLYYTCMRREANAVCRFVERLFCFILI